MGLADRDYMKEASRRTAKVRRMDGSTVNGLRWDGRRNEFVTSHKPPTNHWLLRRIAWAALALGVFTFGWAIACAIVEAEWAGKGPVFEPPASSTIDAGPRHVSR